MGKTLFVVFLALTFTPNLSAQAPVLYSGSFNSNIGPNTILCVPLNGGASYVSCQSASGPADLSNIATLTVNASASTTSSVMSFQIQYWLNAGNQAGVPQTCTIPFGGTSCSVPLTPPNTFGERVTAAMQITNNGNFENGINYVWTIYGPAPPPTNVSGKWALFENDSTLNAGSGCFDSTLPCLTMYLDIADSNGVLASPSNPTYPGTELALSNSVCSGGEPAITGTANNGATVNLFAQENTINNAPGGTWGFSGSYAASQPYTAFNLGGTQSSYSGTANKITGSVSGSSGCPASDNGETFTAVQFPNLGTFTAVTSVVTSQGQSVSVTANLTEDSSFNVTGSGTLTGTCPVSFTITEGLAVGNLYGLNGTARDSQGSTIPNFSLGLALITPFQTAPGQYFIQVWSIDWGAGGQCSADPITEIGEGFAYVHKTHTPFPPRRFFHDPNLSKKPFDWSRLLRRNFQNENQYR